jgi:hypothetical protein
MTDEQQTTEAPAKRPPGRPRKSPPHVRRSPVHQPVHRSNDPDRIEKYEFIPYEAHDKFYIPHDIVNSFRRDYGRALMWVSLECTGKPMDDFVAARRRNHWEEMPSKEAGGPGIFDYLGVRDGIVRVENMVLMHQPIEIYEKARAYDKRMAAGAITNMRQSHATEGVDVSMPGGGSHPSALRKNRHQTSYEEGPKIPE